MNLKLIIYLTAILYFSCTEPTLISDKDCNEVIGGEAIVGECGVCDGPGKTGCDNQCGSIKQLDCAGICGGSKIIGCDSACVDIDLVKIYDYCSICGGDNSTCSGCTDPDACNYDEAATVYSTCDSSNYYCEFGSDGLLDLENPDTSKRCDDIDLDHYCGPGTDACKFVDCTNSDNFGYIGKVIDCNRELPECDITSVDEGENEILCDNYADWVGDIDKPDGGCDFTKVNCIEFNWDDGDCNLVDCLGVHFSKELCISVFCAGCTSGDDSWLGDGTCDNGDNDLGLNFNCVKWNFDGGDCETSSDRIKSIHKLNSKL